MDKNKQKWYMLRSYLNDQLDYLERKRYDISIDDYVEKKTTYLQILAKMNSLDEIMGFEKNDRIYGRGGIHQWYVDPNEFPQTAREFEEQSILLPRQYHFTEFISDEDIKAEPLVTPEQMREIIDELKKGDKNGQ